MLSSSPTSLPSTSRSRPVSTAAASTASTAPTAMVHNMPPRPTTTSSATMSSRPFSSRFSAQFISRTKSPLEAAPRRRSVHDNSHQKQSMESSDSRSARHEPDPFATHYVPSSSFTSYDSSPDSIPTPKRNSLLSAASSSLTRNLSRIRHKAYPTPNSNSQLHLSDVIDITHPVDEIAERERLRDAAALSIGVLLHGNPDKVLDEESDERDIEHQFPEDTHGRSPHLPTFAARPTHSRRTSYSVSLPDLPPFPSTLSALAPHALLSATLPKHYPPSSLRIFALQKQWKPRLLLFSTPTPSGSSYLHLLKSRTEVDRLVITDTSVVFVTDDEVGGRRGVVKVGSENVAGQWFLHIPDPAAAQEWITALKNSILSQRSMRAGLGLPSPPQPQGSEPRGDLDVMLSLRAQALVAPVPQKPPPGTQLQQHPQVSGLKGLFARPRSVSHSTELSMTLRPPSPSLLLAHQSLSLRDLDRRILPDEVHSESPSSTTLSAAEPEPLLSPGLSTPGSLNPPPRRRAWTASVVHPPTTSSLLSPPIYAQPTGNSSVAGSFGLTPPTPVYGGPSASVTSVSTFASGGSVTAGSPISRTNSASTSPGAGNGPNKRWSRQSTLLPKRLTPPSGPPPAAPHVAHPYGRARSSSTSTSHVRPMSAGTNSKRTSISSAISIASSNHQPPLREQRISAPPPPRPVPTFAPPPIPGDLPLLDTHNHLPNSGKRESRLLRLSTISPKPPPNTVLPPRPDDPTFSTHRRRTTSSSGTLDSIPGSPISVSRPLPDPPTRTASLKQRLRLRSTPSPSPLAPSERLSTSSRHGHTRSPSGAISTATPPSTPIGERITTMQNDPDFLQFGATPVMSHLIPVALTFSPSIHSSFENDQDAVAPIALSPPPRRNSRQISPKPSTSSDTSGGDEKEKCMSGVDTVPHPLARAFSMEFGT